MHAAAAFGGYPIFLPQLNRGTDHTINGLRLSQEWQGQFDSIDIRAVHATCAPFPSKP